MIYNHKPIFIIPDIWALMFSKLILCYLTMILNSVHDHVLPLPLCKNILFMNMNMNMIL